MTLAGCWRRRWVSLAVRSSGWRTSPNTPKARLSGRQEWARSVSASAFRLLDFSLASQPFGVLTEKENLQGEESLIREQTGNRSLVLFDRGDEVTVQAGEEGIRFLLVSGKPIEEPVAWYGPIVMNTKAELEQAVSELRDGNFIKHK